MVRPGEERSRAGGGGDLPLASAHLSTTAEVVDSIPLSYAHTHFPTQNLIAWALKGHQ